MQTDLFDFDLPERLIALRPARPRDSARLLQVSADGALDDHVVRDLPNLLRPGDLLVRNDTFVLPAALAGVRPPRSAQAPAVRVSINLIEALGGADWWALARPGKRLQGGDVLAFPADVSAEVIEKAPDGRVRLRFMFPHASVEAALAAAGQPPLPPYIADRRAPDSADAADYQTVYAAADGALPSVAAPTAGLHFTPALLDRLAAAGVAIADVRLAVGAGTFLPVKEADTRDHLMHAERFVLPAATAAAIALARARGGRVIAVGTTALRTLEAAAAAQGGGLAAMEGETDIFITPGFRFQAVDGLMTNFHLPRSTLFMLVSAFCGLKVMQNAYAHAIVCGYRFYSYGDSSLLWRA